MGYQASKFFNVSVAKKRAENIFFFYLRRKAEVLRSETK